jgi:chromosomal replication initiation ATPase DnaA
MRSHKVAVRNNSRLADEIAEQVRTLFEIEASEMFNAQNLAGNVVIARWFFWYVLHVRWNYSYPELSALCGFDDSTVRHGVLGLAEQLKTDRELQAKLRLFGV